MRRSSNVYALYFQNFENCHNSPGAKRSSLRYKAPWTHLIRRGGGNRVSMYVDTATRLQVKFKKATVTH